MPSAHPAMDGGKNYPQHEHQQSGNTLYSIPGLRSQLAVPAMEVRAPAASRGGVGRGSFGGVTRRGLSLPDPGSPCACLQELFTRLSRQLSRGTQY